MALMKHERLIEILRGRFDPVSAVAVADWARDDCGFRAGEDYAPAELEALAHWLETKRQRVAEVVAVLRAEMEKLAEQSAREQAREPAPVAAAPAVAAAAPVLTNTAPAPAATAQPPIVAKPAPAPAALAQAPIVAKPAPAPAPTAQPPIIAKPAPAPEAAQPAQDKPAKAATEKKPKARTRR